MKKNELNKKKKKNELDKKTKNELDKKKKNEINTFLVKKTTISSTFD